MITTKIEVILELGCRDAIDTNKLLVEYEPKKLYTVEANPNLKESCLKNIKDSRVVFFDFAAGAQNKYIDFYEMDKSVDVSEGSSSVFKRTHLADKQKNIGKIKCVRLEDILPSDTKIDLLCMDIQGSEMDAMIGLGSLLNAVKYIIFECPKENKQLHIDAPTREMYFEFLQHRGFKYACEIPENDWETNVMFIRT